MGDLANLGAAAVETKEFGVRASLREFETNRPVHGETVAAEFKLIDNYVNPAKKKTDNEQKWKAETTLTGSTATFPVKQDGDPMSHTWHVKVRNCDLMGQNLQVQMAIKKP